MLSLRVVNIYDNIGKLQRDRPLVSMCVVCPLSDVSLLRIAQEDRCIMTIDNFFSDEECDHWIKVTEQLGYKDAPVTTMSGPVMMKGIDIYVDSLNSHTLVHTDYRDNKRVMCDDKETAAQLFTRLQPLLPEPVSSAVGLNERFRFYRYSPNTGEVSFSLSVFTHTHTHTLPFPHQSSPYVPVCRASSPIVTDASSDRTIPERSLDSRLWCT